MRHLLLLLFLAPPLLAASYEVGHDDNMSAVMLRIYAVVDTNATTQAEYEAFLGAHTLIVPGSGINIGERSLLEMSKAENAWLARAKEGNDSNATFSSISAGNYPLVILVGGTEQNEITRQAVAAGWFNQTDTVEGGYVVKTGKLPSGTVVVAVSDKLGFEEGNPQRESVAYSPLGAIMPKEYVPAAATGISLLLLALMNLGRTVFEFKALDIGRKGKNIGEGAVMYRGLNITEMAAILGASLILGISISWQYFGADFLGWLAINTIICLVGAIIHEVTHRVFAHYFNIKMEYRFWSAGSLLTLVSSYLGNAFSIQGFILEDIPAETPKWKVGLMKLSAPLVSTFIMVFFAFLHYSSPSPIYKIVYTTSALWAMAEILPFGSLDGKDIRDWSHTVWFLAFSFISISYIAVTFLI